MPNIKSAIKRVRVSEERRVLNISQKTALRTAVKNTKLAVAEQNKEKAEQAYNDAIKKLDKAANKGLLHQNKVNRTKSQLAKQLQQLSAE